jgi:hypothetical protein
VGSHERDKRWPVGRVLDQGQEGRLGASQASGQIISPASIVASPGIDGSGGPVNGALEVLDGGNRCVIAERKYLHQDNCTDSAGGIHPKKVLYIPPQASEPTERPPSTGLVLIANPSPNLSNEPGMRTGSFAN